MSKFRLGADYIEISGPQNFVEEQLQNYKELIEASYAKILLTNHKKNLEQPTSNVLKISPPTHLKTYEAEIIDVLNPKIDNYENVFVLNENKFQINCDIPGNSVRTKMLNVVLIFMWAKLQAGVEIITFSDLREICLNTLGSMFDSSNFSKVLDSNKQFFLLMGEKGSKTAKLIRPGVKEAERLISDLKKQYNG